MTTAYATPRHKHNLDAAAPRTRWLRPTPVVQREIVVLLFLTLCYGFFHQVPVWNENSRYDLAVAMVDHHTVRIDPYQANTGDKAFYHGHYYSDKAPGSSLLVVPAYLIMRGAAALQGIHQLDTGQVIAAFAFVACGIPTVLLALLLLRFLRSLVGEGWALTMTIGYALGTIAFPFATMYFGHAASTFFLFAAFYTLWRGRGSSDSWLPILAGLLAGWAVLVDITTMLGVIVLLLYAVSHSRRTAFLMIAGGLPIAALLLGYDWVAFGSPLHLGYASEANQGFAAGMGQGIMGVMLPKPSTLSEILFGPRGLFHLSPWLTLTPLGLLAAQRRELRREVAACGGITLLYLLFNAGYYIPMGGWTPGPRFLSPALPFAVVLVALAPWAFRPLVMLQVVYSVAIFFIATTTMPNAPEAVNDPLGDLWWPRIYARDLGQTTAWLRWGLHGAQPLILLIVAGFITLLTLYATTLSRMARRLAVAGTVVLAALVLTLGTPIELPSGTAAAGAASRIRVRILDAGVTPEPQSSGPLKVTPWAQIENDGRPLSGTMVIFSIYNAAGKSIWAAWYGNMAWQSPQRQRLGVEWSTAGVAPGDYHVSVAVTSAGQRLTYTSLADAGHIHVVP